MPSKHPPVGVKDLLIWSVILPIIGALQQHPHGALAPPLASSDLYDRATAAASRVAHDAAGSLHTPLSEQRLGHYKDTQTDQNTHTRSSTNERALATLSPAESHPAVRAPPAPGSSAATAGLSSRQPARSLQDWQVEDVILLATVDGNIYARDRRTGAARWQLETDRPMVETTHHRHNKSVDENGTEHEDPLWIVEPSQDGSIYVYAPSTGFGMQRLGYTVKELAELAPYASDGHPAVAYTAEKKNTLYTVDASTGHILKSFSSAGSHVNEDRSCRRVNPLESLDGDGCEPIGTLTLGRTEYTIGIQDRDTGEQISTIRYFEWGPNNRDLDLRSKYTTTMDQRYVYTKYDGTIFGLDMAVGNDFRPVPRHKPIYRQKLSSPVARIYDLVRPQEDTSGNAQLVILPQPVGPSPKDLADMEENYHETIFVNCTSDGSWYALSESNYPTVTEGAAVAQCCGDESFTLPEFSWPMSSREREKFMGVHQLVTPDGGHYENAPIGAPAIPAIDPPPAQAWDGSHMIEGTTRTRDALISIRAVVVTIFFCLLAARIFYQRSFNLPWRKSLQFPSPVEQEPLLPVSQVAEQTHEEPHVMIREAEPAEETIFSHQDAEIAVPNADGDRDEEEMEKVDSQEAVDDIGPKEAAEPKKKKATRGKRGGKKAKEREQQVAQVQAQRKTSQVAKPTEIISVPASESPQVAGPLQINSLIIHTDKIIGQGSCGTSVFEGSFEGRAVAVKRMLSQYYELASQEVSFLQQSDDHPNVIRYFCQQRDDHFLYIAVELCQASLFEVWEPEKAKTEERQLQLSALKLAIQQDVPKALQQLAAGLHHLHNLRIIHRDIKPQNILVAFPKRTQPNDSRLVISDFGLGKNLPENVSTLVDPTGNAGTSGWKAPELITQPRDTESKHSQSHSHNGGSESAHGATTSGVKRAADIFSLGCLFFWVLTDGIHPYEDENGWQQLRELNIKRDYKKMDVLARWSDAYEPMQLITSMLAHQPEDRPTAHQVLNHPFFWSPATRLAFLCDCSDHFEREPRGIPDDDYAGDSPALATLESHGPEVIGPGADFLARLDRHFVDSLGRQRKYSGHRLLDLLRALRNKKHHYEDMSDEVKKRVGPLPAGYLGFWCARFPRLLMACYHVVHEIGIQDGDRFRGYFVAGAV